MPSLISAVDPNIEPPSTQRRQARTTVDAGPKTPIASQGDPLLAALAPALDEHIVAHRLIKNVLNIDTPLSDLLRPHRAWRGAGAEVTALPVADLVA